jgi:hypothetical protein
VNNKKGYSNHPETIRWYGKLKALYLRHEKLVKEMKIRRLNHKSPLNIKLAKGNNKQEEYVDSIDKQIRILRNKSCECLL